MKLRTSIVSALGAVGIAAAAFYAPAAAADRVGFNVTFGGPGYAVNVGNYGVGIGYYAPPVVVAPYPYVAPYPPAYRPYRQYYAPVVVPRPIFVHPYSSHRHEYRHDRRHRGDDGYRHRSTSHRGHDGYRHRDR